MRIILAHIQHALQNYVQSVRTESKSLQSKVETAFQKLADGCGDRRASAIEYAANLYQKQGKQPPSYFLTKFRHHLKTDNKGAFEISEQGRRWCREQAARNLKIAGVGIGILGTAVGTTALYASFAEKSKSPEISEQGKRM